MATILAKRSRPRQPLPDSVEILGEGGEGGVEVQGEVAPRGGTCPGGLLEPTALHGPCCRG